MTRTETERPGLTRAAAAAAALALALTAMLELSRVPRSAEFILPRLPGYPFFEFFMEARQSALRRALLVWTATGLLAGSVASVGSCVRKKPAALALLAGACWVMTGSVARLSAWARRPEGLSLAEPAAAFGEFFVLALAAFAAVLSAGQGVKGARPGLLAGTFAVLALQPYFMKPPKESPAVAAPPERVVAVLGGVSDEGSEFRTARVEFDADALRRSLFRAHEGGDAVSRMNLLDNLCHAPDSPANREMVDSLGDEARWRVGPRGAAMLSRAYARFGMADKAAYWASRADIPSGLLAAAPALEGKVQGVVSGVGIVQVALFSHDDPGAPYGLDPARLVAGAFTDAHGRFEFDGLAAGDYFLAAALKGPRPSGFSVKTKEDLHVTATTRTARFRAEALR